MIGAMVTYSDLHHGLGGSERVVDTSAVQEDGRSGVTGLGVDVAMGD